MKLRAKRLIARAIIKMPGSKSIQAIIELKERKSRRITYIRKKRITT
jgi:hypothetical protein